jgi:hypothetical protein
VTMTASKIDLARRCEGAFAVPQLDERNEYQDSGNERHSEWEDDINAGNPPPVLVERWPGYTWRAEVKFAVNIATGVGRELMAPGRRDYSEADALEVCGTADVVGTKEGAPLVIGDRKSFDPNIPRASVNAQLHIAALALGRAYGNDSAEVFIHHEVRPLDVAAIDDMDLDAFFVELRELVTKSAGARQRFQEEQPVQFTTGSHCRWCAGFNACPKQKELVALVKSGASDNRVEMLLPLHDDAAAADAYEFSKQLGMLKKRIDQAIYARAAERPIPLPNGMMLGKVQTLGNEKLDGEIVWTVLRERYGQAIADAAVQRTVTKKRLKEALTLKGAKGQVADMERQVLAEVKNKGGIRQEPKTEIDVYPAKQLKAGNG